MNTNSDKSFSPICPGCIDGQGITYREFLACQIATSMASYLDSTEVTRDELAIADAVLALADAIVDSLNKPRRRKIDEPQT